MTLNVNMILMTTQIREFEMNLGRPIWTSDIQLFTLHRQLPSPPPEPSETKCDINGDDPEVYGPWTEEQPRDIEEARLHEIKRLYRLEFISPSAVHDTDTSATERELRRHFGNLNRVYDEVERAGVAWDPDNRSAPPTDPITDAGSEVEEIATRMARCNMRTPSGSQTQTVPAVIVPRVAHGGLPLRKGRLAARPPLLDLNSSRPLWTDLNPDSSLNF
jgi:hypothetical protein